MPRVFWMKMSCMKVFSMTYFIQINFIKNDLNKNVYNNNSDYLQKARKYGHFTGYKN